MMKRTTFFPQKNPSLFALVRTSPSNACLPAQASLYRKPFGVGFHPKFAPPKMETRSPIVSVILPLPLLCESCAMTRNTARFPPGIAFCSHQEWNIAQALINTWRSSIRAFQRNESLCCAMVRRQSLRVVKDGRFMFYQHIGDGIPLLPAPPPSESFLRAPPQQTVC